MKQTKEYRWCRLVLARKTTIKNHLCVENGEKIEENSFEVETMGKNGSLIESPGLA